MVPVSALAYSLERLGIVMEPEPDDPREAWGVLNPGAARGPDGELYLFPRLVAAGNYSRIGRARVLFDRGTPTGVERLGLALEPLGSWESKGVEDPRITFVAALGLFLMAYTAYGPQGPRVAIAASADLNHWERHGLARFGEAIDGCDNKDAAFFPEPVPGPDGRASYALLHRGVSGRLVDGVDLQPAVRYCAGAMVLDPSAVWKVVDRTKQPLLEPETEEERAGVVPNVVFPTAFDDRSDGT